MLKSDADPDNDFNSMCAEVHCYSQNTFVISCLHCDLITNNFLNFRVHYRNTHADDVAEAQRIPVKSRQNHTKRNASPPHNGRPPKKAASNAPTLVVPKVEKVLIALKNNDTIDFVSDAEETEEKSHPPSIRRVPVPPSAEDVDRQVEKEIEIILGDTGPSRLPFRNDGGNADSDAVEEMEIKIERVELSESSDVEHSPAPKSLNHDSLSGENFKGSIDEDVLADWRCRFCGKIFSSKQNRVQHEVRHSSVHPFRCEQCSKGFYTQCELKNHLHSHSDIRGFACDLCGREFRLAWHLKKHRRTHFDHKAILPCPVCGKLFKFKDNLRNHLVVHNTTITHTCQVCNEGFTNAKKFNRHRKRVHTEEEVTQAKRKMSGLANGRNA